MACSMGLVLCLHDSGLAQTTNTAGDSRLLGKWEAIGVIRDGQFNERNGDCVYSFGENTFEISTQGQQTTTIAYSTNNRQFPKQFNATLGSEQAKMIYGFDSERLWISHSRPGSNRPSTILEDDNHLSILVFRPLKTDQVQASELDVVFDYCYGNRGQVDLKLARKKTLEAEKNQQPTAIAWAAFARCYNMAGFQNEFSKDHETRFQTLVPQLEHQANSGDVEAKFLLGLATLHGFAVEEDRRLSEQYLKEAASKGHSPSAYWLGRSLTNGRPKESISMLKLAAAFGNAEAMSSLGIICFDGLGTPSDTEQALQWYSASAERGCSFGMVGLGLMVEDREPQKAFRLFETAAAMNHPFALSKLANCYQFGKGCEKDQQKAVETYLKAIDLNDHSAAYELGKIYLGQKQYSDALEMFKWADGKGHLPATTAVGLCYEEGWGCDPDIDIAKTIYRKAANAGSDDAKQQLARLEPKPQPSFRPAANDYGTSYSSSQESGIARATEAARRDANRAVRNFQRRINRGW